MILRSNYLLVRQYLKDLKDIYQLADSSIGRYESYLRHLLEWAGETPLHKVMPLRPTFPGYVTSLPGRYGATSLAAISQKKIIESARRLFMWSRQNHSKEFAALTPTWLASLRPPRNKNVQGEHKYVNLEEVLKLLSVPHAEGDLALLRDQAAAAFDGEFLLDVAVDALGNILGAHVIQVVAQLLRGYTADLDIGLAFTP